LTDREVLEKAEAREIAHDYLYCKKDKNWLANRLAKSVRIYGRGSEERIRAFMRAIWKQELLRLKNETKTN
jgi:hypothetical protein